MVSNRPEPQAPAGTWTREPETPVVSSGTRPHHVFMKVAPRQWDSGSTVLSRTRDPDGRSRQRPPAAGEPVPPEPRGFVNRSLLLSSYSNAHKEALVRGSGRVWVPGGGWLREGPARCWWFWSLWSHVPGSTRAPAFGQWAQVSQGDLPASLAGVASSSSCLT